MAKTRCDSCQMAKTPLVYVRLSKKLCSGCWQAEKATNKSLIRSMIYPVDRDPPLGYNFIVNEFFTDPSKARKYADWAFMTMKATTN